tara:strand:+ start:563 stop:736 length:174 start_codon:yes stop_codon:yes gene_type:complete
MQTKFLVFLTAIMASTAIAAPAAVENETRDVAEVAAAAAILADNCFRASNLVPSLIP